MNVNQVEFAKRDSGITWITFRAATGEIEVYPVNRRDMQAIADFVNDPHLSELKIRDHCQPVTEPTRNCAAHGIHYNDECPLCLSE